ncbi:bacillithiol system redox-active protein YtxJ [Flavobacterium sp.]|uniref:bacillithiol system redox-active protein YtxJ n=1 Tax=Flavobacterium sp. TaxID=239 RepID=UPI0025CFC87D|nr:bacillithiol system redox-active protein YtxJ [Flavobacterium sp.]
MSLLKNIFGTNEEHKSALKVGWRLLTDVEQLNEIITASVENPVVIFKHSTRCHISKMVLRQFENDFDLEEKIIPYFLDLIAHRSISNEIAVRFVLS